MKPHGVVGVALMVALGLTVLAVHTWESDPVESPECPIAPRESRAGDAGLATQESAAPQVRRSTPGDARELAERSIEGVVVDTTGAPIVDALVGSVDPVTAKVQLVGRADLDGRFGFVPTQREPLSLRFDKAGYTTAVRTHVRTGDHLRVVLESGVLTEMHVISASSSKPIAHAWIGVQSGDPTVGMGGDSWTTLADENGLARLELPRSPSTVSVVADGYAKYVLQRFTPSQPIHVISLRPLPEPPTPSVWIRVVDEDTAQPLGECQFEYGDTVNHGEGLFQACHRSTTSGEDLICVRAAGHAQRWFTVRASDHADADHAFKIALPRAATLQGVVSDEQGAPIEGARVLARLEGGSVRIGFASDTKGETYTDLSGRFSIDHLRPDATYRITIVHDDHESFTSSWQAERSEALSVQLVRSWPLVVRARTESGENCAIAFAQAMRVGAADASSRVTYEDDGSVSIRTAGWPLRIDAKGKTTSIATVVIQSPPREGSITMTLPSGVEWAIRVRDESGSGVANARVVASLTSDGRSEPVVAHTDEAGDVVLPGITPGTWSVLAMKGMQHASATVAVAGSGRSSTELRLESTTGAICELAEPGSAIDDGEVSVTILVGDPPRLAGIQPFALAPRVFVPLEPLTTTTLELRVTGLPVMRSERFALTKGEARTVRFSAAPLAKCRVRVADSRGAVLEGVRVVLTSKNPSIPPVEATTHRDGIADFPECDVETYDVRTLSSVGRGDAAYTLGLSASPSQLALAAGDNGTITLTVERPAGGSLRLKVGADDAERATFGEWHLELNGASLGSLVQAKSKGFDGIELSYLPFGEWRISGWAVDRRAGKRGVKALRFDPDRIAFTESTPEWSIRLVEAK